MEQNNNKYIAASYALYDVTDGKKELVEETIEGRPFEFISGFGITIPAFEQALVDLKKVIISTSRLRQNKLMGRIIPSMYLNLTRQSLA